MKIVKILFYTVVFLTLLIPVPLHSVYATEFYAAPEDANTIIERDGLHDTMREYEARIDDLNQRLLALKMDQEWLRLKIEDIENQGRIIPQTLIRSRSTLLKKRTVAEKEKKLLIEQVKLHKQSIEKLDHMIHQNNSGRCSQNNMIDHELFAAENQIAAENQENTNLTSLDDGNMEEILKNQISTLGLKEWVNLIRDQSGLRLEVHMPILFAPNKSKLNKSYGDFFKKLARLMRPYDVKVHVKGYTDSLESKKTSGIDLSAKRAVEVVKALIKHKMNPSVFQVSGRGEFRKGSNVNKKSHAVNRSAELTAYF